MAVRRRDGFHPKLGMQAKEMPRLLKEGLATKKLKAKGPETGDDVHRGGVDCDRRTAGHLRAS
jgi:hypothetical protein